MAFIKLTNPLNKAAIYVKADQILAFTPSEISAKPTTLLTFSGAEVHVTEPIEELCQMLDKWAFLT